MHPASLESKKQKYPFTDMKIDDSSFLDNIEGRNKCRICQKSRKFYCYECFVPLPCIENRIPKVNLPIKVDIIKHKREIDGKSTSSHGAILAPDDIKVYIYPDIPDYEKEPGTFLVYPAAHSISIQHVLRGQTDLKIKQNFGLDPDKNMGTLLRLKLSDVIDNETDCSETAEIEFKSTSELPIKKIVLIDSTWMQSRGIYFDEKIKSLKTIILQTRNSFFWRYQRNSPRWFLATIEAIHQLLLEIHIYAFGLDPNYRGLDNLEVFLDAPLYKQPSNKTDDVKPYCGQYDNLLFFFQYQYDLIHKYHDPEKLLAYKRPGL